MEAGVIYLAIFGPNLAFRNAKFGFGMGPTIPNGISYRVGMNKGLYKYITLV
jgi:hypothetical protein